MLLDINGPIQNIGGVGPSRTHSPSEIALIALVSRKSNEFRTSPFDLAMWVAAFKEYSYTLEVRSFQFSGKSEAWIGDKLGKSRSVLPRSFKLLSNFICSVGRYRNAARPLGLEVKK